LYIESRYLYEYYAFECLWAQGTGFKFAESNEPKQAQKYTTKATLPHWDSFMRKHSNQSTKNAVQENSDVFDIIKQVASGQ